LGADKADAQHLPLLRLRARDKRPRRGSPEESDELASSHDYDLSAEVDRQDYSMP
jgi:hypothetical protein